MKKWIFLLLGVGLIGCDYTVPLVTEPQMDIDREILGLWEATDDASQKEGKKPNRLLFLPLNQKEYLVTFTSDEGDTMFGRACLCLCAGKKLIQVEWVGTGKGQLAQGRRVYQYAMYSMVNEKFQIRLLNADIVDKNVKTSEALMKALEKNKDNPDSFKNLLLFKKVPANP